MNKEQLIEKLWEFESKFGQDKEVIGLVEKLKQKFDEMYNDTFTYSEVASDDFDETCEEYYMQLRENDPDDASIFQVMWFK